MGRILNRYVFVEVLVPFFFGLSVFTFILLIARILKMVEMVVNRGVPLLDMLKVFSLVLPAFLEVTVPMALLLAILLGFGRLSSDNEIVAMKTSGISLYQMLVPVGIFMSGIAILTFAIAIWVRPWSNATLKVALFDLVKSRASAGFKEKVFNNDFPGLVIYVEEIEPGGTTLKGVLIADVRDPENRTTVLSKVGLLLPDESTRTVTLRLLDGTIYGTNLRQKSVQKTDFNIYDYSLDLTTFAEERSGEKDPKEMTLGELRRRIADRQAAGASTAEERIELHRKFSIPFACVVFALVGVPLGIQPQRAVRSRGFALSLVLIFLYYVPLTVGETLAKKEILPAALGLWVPNLLFLGLGLALFAKSAQERPFRSLEWAEALWWRTRARILQGLRARSPGVPPGAPPQASDPKPESEDERSRDRRRA